MIKLDIEDLEVFDENLRALPFKIERALTFQELIHPTAISGEVRNSHVNLEYTMSNGDIVEFRYTSDPSGKNEDDVWIHINKQKGTQKAYMPSLNQLYEIRQVYIKHLQEKLKA